MSFPATMTWLRTWCRPHDDALDTLQLGTLLLTGWSQTPGANNDSHTRDIADGLASVRGVCLGQPSSIAGRYVSFGQMRTIASFLILQPVTGQCQDAGIVGT